MMKKLIKYVVPAAVLSAALILSPFTSTASAKGKYGGSFRVALTGVPTSLNPHVYRSFYDVYAHYFQQELLVSRDRNYNPVEGVGLAESWETPDNYTIIFHLKRGVKFHDGTPVNARAVKRNFDYVMNPATRASQVPGYIPRLKSWEAVDDHTVKLTLKTPFSPIFYGLVKFPISNPAAHEKLGKDFAFKPVDGGFGPFKFAEFVEEDHVTFVKNENYHRKGKPYLDKVVLTNVPDTAVAIASMKAGEVHAAQWVGDYTIGALEKKMGNLNVVLTGGGIQKFYMDNTHPPFNNKLIRKAMNYAFDRDGLNQGLFFGLGRIATGPWPHFSFGFNPDMKAFPYDPEKAKKLLKEAGYPDGFEFTLTCSSTPASVRFGEALQDQLAKVGVKAKIEALSGGALIAKVLKGPMDAGVGATHGYAYPSRIVRSYYMTGAVWSGNRYKYPDFDKMANDVINIYDRVEQEKLYRKMFSYLQEQAVDVFLLEVPGMAITTKKAHFRIDAEGLSWHTEDWWLEK